LAPAAGVVVLKEGRKATALSAAPELPRNLRLSIALRLSGFGRTKDDDGQLHRAGINQKRVTLLEMLNITFAGKESTSFALFLC
jgi:hypothetical protein